MLGGRGHASIMSPPSGGFRGAQGACAPPPPWAPKFFRFHVVFGKFWQNRMLAPPLGKSWIRRCPPLDPPMHVYEIHAQDENDQFIKPKKNLTNT